MDIFEVNLPKPPIGNKIFLAQDHGLYILEKGPALWRAMANTHMGNGSISVYDGLPDENGLFSKAAIVTKAKFVDGQLISNSEELIPKKPLELGGRIILDGRMIFNANPPILGMWMFDGYCENGLTLVLHDAGSRGLSPCVTITWVPKL